MIADDVVQLVGGAVIAVEWAIRQVLRGDPSPEARTLCADARAHVLRLGADPSMADDEETADADPPAMVAR